MIDILLVVILGIIEGITEWLPISSTGHLIVAREFITKFATTSLSIDFFNMFDVVIQLGAILAIVCIFFKRLIPIDYNKENKTYSFTNEVCKDKWMLWLKVLIACIPAGVIGILFNEQIEMLFNNSIVIGATLIVYGVLFIIIEIHNKNKSFCINTITNMSFKVVFVIGVVQLLALIPGTSRSGVTILGAMLLSVDRTTAAEFSFFLSIPIMFGASFIKIIDFKMNNSELILLLIGMVTSFLVSIITVKALMNFIKRYDFSIFGYYRIIFAIFVLIIFGIIF